MLMFDPYMWLAIPGLLIGIYAQIKLSSTYNRYIQVGAASGISGAGAAREILDRAGLGGMPVQEVGGHLTDHYDPTKKALFLSSENYHGRSIAALGVAAHEAGHALQHKAAYAPLKLRMWMVPATQFASTAWIIILLIGMFMGFFPLLLQLAIGIFAVITFFQLVTLPVEFDASRRAKDQLLSIGLVDRNEQQAVTKVLNAAALTYVAALVSSILMLLRLILMARHRD
jgi:Zn-dependent membrane protease YugP